MPEEAIFDWDVPTAPFVRLSPGPAFSLLDLLEKSEDKVIRVIPTLETEEGSHV